MTRSICINRRRGCRGSALIELPLAIALLAFLIGVLFTYADTGLDAARAIVRADARQKQEWVR